MLNVIKKITNFRDYKIRNKLILVILVFLTLNVCISILSLVSISNIKNADMNKNLIQKIEKHASDIINREKEYLDTLSDYQLSKYTTDINNLIVTFKDLKKIYTSETDIDSVLQLIDSHMQNFFAISDNVRKNIDKGYDEKTLSKIIDDAKLELSQQHSDFYATLTRFNKKITDTIDDYIKSVENKIKLSFLFLGIITVVITLLIVYGVNRSIASPVLKLAESMRKFGAGERDIKIDIDSKDEIGELANSFNQMAKELNQSYSELEEKVKERTKEITAVNKQLQEATQAKSKFLANMSHELRTPLNSIIGFSEVLLDQTFGSLNEKQEKYTNNIHTSGKHLLTLINDILDLSKIEAGKIELKLEDVSIKELLDECHTLVKTMASKKSLLLDFMVEGISTKADPVRLKQIMYNLLSNAIKFTPDNGRVSVEAKIVNGMVQISVQDTGIGIAKEDYEKVFEEFVQIESSYAKQYQGTGLGLPLTRKLVELHGGRIWLESEPGKGSAFTFTLPYSEERRNFATEDTEDTEDVLITKEKPIVLVVEDEKQTRDLLTIYLEGAGYQVVYAIDGEEAIKKAKEIKPYAITLDIMLPKKDGFVVLNELKTLPETKDIPVTVISMVDDKDLGLSLGAAEYLIKPIDKKELARKLKKYSCTMKEKKEGVNILLIDDNPEDVELLSSFLEPEGIKVIKAYGGEEGINLAIEKQPDAIVADLIMPNVSGFEVVQRLKKDERVKNIPIIICTGKDLQEKKKIY